MVVNYKDCHASIARLVTIMDTMCRGWVQTSDSPFLHT